MIKSRRLIWAGQGKERIGYRILAGKPEETTRKDQDVGGRITLIYILERMGWYGLR
jgi:hypothetical protein